MNDEYFERSNYGGKLFWLVGEMKSARMEYVPCLYVRNEAGPCW